MIFSEIVGAPGQFLPILLHELKGAFRDRRSIIDSTIGGVVLFFLFAVMMHFLNSLFTDTPARVYLRGGNPTAAGRVLIANLKASGDIQFVETKNPDRDLNAGVVDAVISIPDDSKIEISTAKDISETTSGNIFRAVREARKQTWLGLYPNVHCLPSHYLAFDIWREPVGVVEKNFPTVAVGAFGLILFRLASSMVVAADTVWHEERRRNATSILITPINRLSFVLAKCLTMLIMAGASTAIVIGGSLIIAVLFVMTFPQFSNPGTLPSSSSPLSALQVTAVPLVCITIAALVVTGLACAMITLFMTAALRPRLAARLNGYNTLFVILPAFLAAHHSVQLNEITQFIPFLNLALIVKAQAANNLSIAQVMIVFCSSFAVLFAIAMVTVRLMASERFVLGILEE